MMLVIIVCQGLVFESGFYCVLGFSIGSGYYMLGFSD